MFAIRLNGASGASFVLDARYVTRADAQRVIDRMVTLSPSPMFHTREIIPVS